MTSTPWLKAEVSLAPYVTSCDTCHAMTAHSSVTAAVDWTVDHREHHPHEVVMVRIEPLGQVTTSTRWQRLRSWATRHLTAYGERLQAGTGRP
jgi:hypothetical protein